MSERIEKMRVVNQETGNSKADSSNIDILRLASEAGHSLAGNIGAKAFVELEPVARAHGDRE